MDSKDRQQSFSQLSHSQYIEEIYEQFKTHPEDVDPSWRRFFEGMEFASESPLSGVESPEKASEAHALIEAYRREGFRYASFNPLEAALPLNNEPLFDLKTYGLLPDQSVPSEGFSSNDQIQVSTLEETLRKTYCSTVGFEFKHLENVELKEYLQSRVEEGFFKSLGPDEKKQILHSLNRSELFESFIHTKYVGQKRFSIEGLETFIPCVKTLIDSGSAHDLEEVVICMAHRGRLNLLANIFEKPYAILFNEFAENYEPSQEEGAGDVKYHKGYSADIEGAEGKRVHISIPPNSSHLESVNAVALGQVRAKQTHKKDQDKKRILAIQVHGDASISGQGVIYEDMQMCRLNGYETGGSIHIIMDNQIGFTTHPNDARSTPYPSDIAKTFDAPVFHVNAEDPEGCILASRLAIEVRQKFHTEVFIHLVGYRKYGHNEGDEPSYTQPLQYQKIRKKTSIRAQYRDQLIEKGIISKEAALNAEKDLKNQMQKALDESASMKDKPLSTEQLFGNRWSYWKEARLKDENDLFDPVDTQVDEKFLDEVAQKITEVPGSFKPHKKIIQMLGMRRAAVLEKQAEPIMDWGLVENLAYGTLLLEGYPIRLAGQDCQRGTFSHRHAVLFDQENGSPYIPLNHMSSDQAELHIYNSHLSEYGCLGFEYGYSISTSKGLVIWEAQFGDFANGAQIIIDAYVANGEEKWNRLTNLVMLLPHGYEGQGPEHSSARMERFLQLCGNKNMVVVNPTTPAQLFHILRRQALKYYRKPLIIFSPKKLLRYPKCVSSKEDLTKGAFQPMLEDPSNPKNPKKLVFCTGKVYYDAKDLQEKLGVNDIAFVRIEQLYPINNVVLSEMMHKYAGFEVCVWLQEEPKNMGAWYYIQSVLRKCLPEGKKLKYCGRDRSASPAQGSHKRHNASFKVFMSQLFDKEIS